MYCTEKTSTGDFSCDVVINEPPTDVDPIEVAEKQEDGFDSKMALIIVVVAIVIFVITLVVICCIKKRNTKDRKKTNQEFENSPVANAQGANDISENDDSKKP